MAPGLCGKALTSMRWYRSGVFGRCTGLGEVVKVWSDDSGLLVRRDSRELACRLLGVGALREGDCLQARGSAAPRNRVSRH